jgi:3-oxoacyl-[acyl-carrier protein] reductase
MRIVIVGGSSSVGRATIDSFSARGDTVLATYGRNPFEAPVGVKLVSLDLKAEETFGPFAVEVEENLGPPDAVLLLAGILPGKSLLAYDSDLMNEVMQVNLTSQALLIQALMPRMAPGGQMLIMSSISGERGSFDPIYAASKAALIGLVKSLATWHGDKVRFNCVAPALIEGSAMFEAMSPERREHHKQTNPTKELLKVEDLAQVMVDLVQTHWRHLNGAIIRLNGGVYL